MNKFFYTTVFSFVFTIIVIAQPIRTVPYDMMIEIAQEQYALGEYYQSIDWYQKAYKVERTEDVALQIAYMQYILRNYDRAESWYSRVISKDEDHIYVNEYIHYANTLKALGEFDQAIEIYEQIVNFSEDQSVIDQAELQMEGIRDLENFNKNEDVVVSFIEGNINSPSQEQSPVQFEDGTLYFSSFNRKNVIVLDGDEKKYHAKIYTADIGEKGFNKPKALSKSVNRDDYHTGNPTFSLDKRTMYFTRQLIQHNEILESKIYASTLGDEDWKSPNRLDVVNGNFISKHPAIGELFGKQVIFFVSDMDGGFGGMDIYYSEINGDQFSAPVNLGESINTAGDDITPFYKDGILYFSSNGRPTMGGFDIFKSEWNGEVWSSPKNMGFTYNSSCDDMYFSLGKNEKRGYLVSNRPDEKKKSLKSKTCCDDIYMFNTREILIDLLLAVGDKDQTPLYGAVVYLENQTLPEEPEILKRDSSHLFRFNLEGDRNYKIVTSRNGYHPDTTTISTMGIIETETIRKKILLNRDESNMTPSGPKDEYVPEYETVTINQEIRLNNIYYDFDKWDILIESEADLTVLLNLMNQYSNMVIELSSHTDSRGTTPYNQQLSQKRAQSAKDWLVKRGIEESRIKAVGYGESQILNNCVNGRKCTEEKHRFNRRTQFKIIEGPQSIQIDKRVLKRRVKSFIRERQYTASDSIPIITFDTAYFDLGVMKAGEIRMVTYHFTNTGTVPLIIDLVTACKCTETDWTREPILPGQRGMVSALFDSSGMEGEYLKIVDIISNTEPIVKEAEFRVFIEKKSQD